MLASRAANTETFQVTTPTDREVRLARLFDAPPEVNRHPHGEAAFHGEYLEIAPPGRLVFTEIFEEFPDSVSVVTTELMAEGDKTRLEDLLATLLRS